MFFSSWLRKQNSKPRTSRRATSTFRPRLEVLEGRDVPSTLTVNSAADSGGGSLRAEIAAAKSGDTIVFDPSLAGTTIQLTSGELVINKNLTIQGSGWISGNGTGVNLGGPGGTSRVFEVDGAGTTVTLSGLTIIDGEGVYANGSSHAGDGQGGAVLNYGLLTLSGCTVSNSLATSLGGGIYNAGTLTVSNCTVSNNSAGYGGGFDNGNGGGIYNTGTLIVSGSTVSQNTANGPNLYGGFTGINGNGGGIYNAGSMNVSNTTMEFNLAAFAGAGIFNAYGATGSLTGSGVLYNDYDVAFDSYGQVGGGIYNDGTLSLSACNVYGNNYALEGGDIYNDYSGKLTIQSSSYYYLYNVGAVLTQPAAPTFSLNFGSITYNRKTHLYSEMVTLTDTSGTLTGPLSLELTNLPSGVVLADASGTTNSNPYIRFLSSGKTLAKGASVTITLTFTAANLSDVAFGTEIVAL